MTEKDFDRISREKIRSDINTNYFVEAGAGSGKTTILVDRMVAMVEGGVDISKICAITFTRAAAREFYARFQMKLTESDSENCEKALRDIDLCFMGTIDSFCNMILSEHPAEAGVPSDTSVTEGEEMDALYLREYSRILQGQTGSDELRRKAVRFSANFYNAPDVFLSGMRMLSASKDAHLNYELPPDEDPDEVFREKKARLTEILRYLCDHPEALAADKPKDAKASFESLMQNIDTLEDTWNDDPGNIERILGSLRGLRIIHEFDIRRLGPDWERYFVEHTGRGSWYEINPDTDPLMIDELKRYRFSIAADFIHACMEPVSAVLKKEGKLSYSDYLLYLRDMLREDAGRGGRLIRHIYRRHSYFLVDEFQDTNPVQAEILFYLTAADPQPVWSECVPVPGSLFIVGDPKQSIYRFQNADVSQFLRIRERFRDPEVGEILTLYRNYRSSRGMCDWFNEVFSTLLPEDTEIQSRFSPIPTHEKPEYKASLEGAYCCKSFYSRGISGREDPENTARIIERIVNDPDMTIQGRDIDAVPRRVRYSDFKLITPRKTHLSMYMRALTEHGIPFMIEGKVLFNECEPLRAISYLMSAVADPFDAGAMFAAMNLSGCKVTAEDIRRYAERAKFMSPASLFSLLLEELRVFARAGTDNAEYVYYALELLRSAEIDGTAASVRDGAAFISGLVNDESDAERCVQLQRDADRVHVANLHKMKGLEAPVVILADPDIRGRAPMSRVDYSASPPESYIFAFDETLKTTDYAEERAKEEAVLEAERMRLLYVAATRAENALIISGMLKTDGSYSVSNPWLPLLQFTDRDIFDILKRDVYSIEGEYPPGNVRLAGTEQAYQDADELYSKAEASGIMNDTRPLLPSYAVRKPSTVTYESLISSEDGNEEAILTGSSAADTAALGSVEIQEIQAEGSGSEKELPLLTGTMIHRLMEALVSSGNRYDLNQLVETIVLEYGADPDIYAGILREAGKVIRSGGYPQQGSAPQDILNELLTADEVYCELPFCYRDENGGIWHGVMDAVYCKDGAWHIIDYKTNADADDLDEHYRDQLSAYIQAFRVMTGHEADAMIYHIDK